MRRFAVTIVCVAILAGCGSGTQPSKTDLVISAAGARASRAATRGATTTEPPLVQCPGFVLTPFFDRRTGDTVTLFYRLCNGTEEYLYLDTSQTVDTVATVATPSAQPGPTPP